jgi:RNA polymerase sigma-70 factor (ECF subfamily)
VSDRDAEIRLAADRALLDLARKGDVVAFEKLVAQYTSRVYNLALRMTSSAQDAQEITQDTFLSAYQNLGNFRGESAFGSWVHRIAANYALMRLRHKKVVHEAEAQLKGEMEFSEDGTLLTYPTSQWGKRADDQALDSELRGAIQRAVEALPVAYRTVFLLKDVEGLSYEEIAQSTHETVPAVKSRLHRARLNLREAIDQFYAARPRS